MIRSLAATPEDEIMAITKSGMIVRCSVKDVRQTGRSTQGVKLVSLKKEDRVMSVANVISVKEE